MNEEIKELNTKIANLIYANSQISKNVATLTDLVIGLNTSLIFLSMRVSLNEREVKNELNKKNME